MTTTASLNASPRDGTGKGVARKLRAAGQVPAVLYGKDMETMHLTVDAHEAELLFSSISVASTVVDLNVQGENGPTQTLVREVQVHPFKPELLHIDFMRIQAGVAVEVDVPLHLEGIPAGVRVDGGVLEQIAHEIPVKCVPAKIPDAIVVDVTALEIGDSLHVSDLPVDEDVEILLEPERTIVNVSAPRIIEEDLVEEEELELVGELEAEGEEEAAEESEESEEPEED